MSSEREALREAVARAIDPGDWSSMAARERAERVLAVIGRACAKVADGADDDMPFAAETADYIRGHIAGTAAAARAVLTLTEPKP